MQYADYTYYTDKFKGKLITSEDEFDGLAINACAFIDKITFERAKMEADSTSVKNAVCAICEVYQQFGAREGISSENNDGYAITYSQTSAPLEKRLMSCAALHLPARLLYRGIDA